MVQYHELDLVVGDVFIVGDRSVTVIDIDDGEVTFRVDDTDSTSDELSNDISEAATNPLPR